MYHHYYWYHNVVEYNPLNILLLVFLYRSHKYPQKYVYINKQKAQNKQKNTNIKISEDPSDCGFRKI